MASQVRYVPRRGAVLSLADDAAMRSMLYRRAQLVAAAAQSNAPVDSGRYRSSFSIRWAHTDRTVARVHNSAPYAASLEFGGSKSPRHRPLGRALDAGSSP